MRADGKGQVSMEYVMIMAAMLLILTLLIVIFNGIYSQQALRTQYLQAHQAIVDLSASSQEVWSEGNGSSQLVSVYLPLGTVMSSSHFTDHLIDLYLLSFGDVSLSSSFPINGTWPPRPGQTLFSVYNNGTTVLIRPAGRLEANLTGFYFSFLSGHSEQLTLGLRNRANLSYTITHTLSCPPAASTCTSNATSPATLLPEGAQAAVLTMGSSTAGLSTGYLQLDMVPSSSALPTERYILPITIRVS